MSDMPDKIFAARVAQEFYKGSWANSINPNHQTEYIRRALVDELNDKILKLVGESISSDAPRAGLLKIGALIDLAIQGDKE